MGIKNNPVILMDSFRDIREAKKRNRTTPGASDKKVRVGINKKPENHRKATGRLKFATRKGVG